MPDLNGGLAVAHPITLSQPARKDKVSARGARDLVSKLDTIARGGFEPLNPKVLAPAVGRRRSLRERRPRESKTRAGRAGRSQRRLTLFFHTLLP